MATGNKLVIVESPTKAKKIGGYLGDGYTVMASVGHIRDLAQPSQVPAQRKAKFGKFGVDVDDGFEPYYIVGADKKHTVTELKSALKDADELYLATDEDREGEAIAWHLVQTLKPKVPVKRMVFHEITKDAIRSSLDSTREVDDNMVDAQETRRVLDRLYGYELSPVLWRKVGPGLSAGRVQSVATRLIVERERERMAFTKAAYWDVVAVLGAPQGGSNHADQTDAERSGGEAKAPAFEARLVSLDGKRLAGSKDFDTHGKLTPGGFRDNVIQLDETRATTLAERLRLADFTVSSLESKPYRRRPLPPFTTSTLQQAAGNRLSMSSRQAMRAAQGLYENGYITYMRTDSVSLSKEAIAAARSAVEFHFGERYLSDGPKQYATKTAGAQEAHECIRPAGSHFLDPKQLQGKVPPDQLKLYRLIWQRTLASQMADAVGSTATVRVSADGGDDGQAVFQASGTVIEFPGFLKAIGSRTPGADESKSKVKANSAGAGESENAALPVLHEGDTLHASSVEPDGHETQPPARYTEASLVKTLEAREIGRPSTYASIISTIIDRGYVYERGRALIPSWLAFAVIKLLETNFPQYVDYQFTAQMENGLDEIAHGRQTGRDWLTRFYFGAGKGAAQSADQAHEGLQQQVAQLGEIDARAINTIEIGDGLHVRVGRFGPYLEDMNALDEQGNPKRASIPETIAPDELTVQAGHELIENNAGGPRTLGTDPATGGTVEVRKGRFGPYVALVKPEASEPQPDESATSVDDGQSDASGAKDSAAGSTSSKTGKPVKSRKTTKVANNADRPKMASLFKSMDPDTVTLDEALKLLSLPRTVGSLEEASAESSEQPQSAVITANNGRYGPYLTKTLADGTTDTRSLPSEDAIFTIDLEGAKALFAQPKYGRGSARAGAKPPLRELGPDPDTGRQVSIKDGFYGAYITDGETNRTLPKQYTPESIEVAEAFRLLAEKRAAGPTKRRRRSTARGAKSKTAGGKKKATAKRSASPSSPASVSKSKATSGTRTRKAASVQTAAS